MYNNSSGQSNIAMGTDALRQTISSSNIGLGVAAMFVNTLGSGNIAIGENAAYPTSLSNTLIGNSNTIIGTESARNIQGSAAGNLVLGNSVNLPTGNGSNQVVIKNLIFGTGASGTGTTIQTTAKAGINVNNPQSTLDVEGNMAIGAT
ncbi:MAG: hypothetical protein EBR82_83175, partial [Caulobacteraceae bacterium]|nr:hypothetical protein [Caulobacteraceae bacterium]